MKISVCGKGGKAAEEIKRVLDSVLGKATS